MNSLSLAEKKKLLSLAKRLKAANNRHENYARQANNILKTSQITLGEFGNPTTNASRNIVRRIARLENMMNYTKRHVTDVATKILTNFPAVANMSHNNIIRNATESIRRHEFALRNIHSGRYQTHGKRQRASPVGLITQRKSWQSSAS